MVEFVSITSSIIFFLIFTLLFLFFLWRWQFSKDNEFKKSWIQYFLLYAFNEFFIHLFPIGQLTFLAHNLQLQKKGLLNVLPLPSALQFLLLLILSDFCLSSFHYYSHKNHYLWRFHQVHHIEHEAIAWPTAFLFHPFEFFWNNTIKFVLVIIFGFTPIAVLTVEILNLVSNFLSHSKVDSKLLERIEKIFVTPMYHLKHHGKDVGHYSLQFSFWDRFFPQEFDAKKSWPIEPLLQKNDLKFWHLIFYPFHYLLKKITVRQN